MLKDSPLKLCEQDRPAYKMLNQGAFSLTDSELIAILIKGNDSDGVAERIARELLSSVDNDLTRLARLSITEMTVIKGLTRNKATIIAAALHLGRRKAMAMPAKRLKISSSKDVLAHIQPLLQDLSHEEFWCLFLNRNNQVIATEKISSGGVTGTIVDPKIIFKTAIKNLASGIIMCHNHPSGNLRPSDADLSLTKKIQDAGKLMDIQVLDHLIIANEKYYSFADEGKC